MPQRFERIYRSLVSVIFHKLKINQQLYPAWHFFLSRTYFNEIHDVLHNKRFHLLPLVTYFGSSELPQAVMDEPPLLLPQFALGADQT